MGKFVYSLKQECTDWYHENSSLLSKRNLKLLFIVFFIYFVGYSSIFRANYFYIDDLGRATQGYYGWYDFGRYLSILGAFLIQWNSRLCDASPLMQGIAALIMSVATILLCYIFSTKKIKSSTVVAGLIIGFFPYFLECISYKFDSPFMAFSVMVSFIPFLFVRERKMYILSSIICLLSMCLTYQASSGIYIVMVLLLGFIKYNKGEMAFVKLIKFYVLSAILYICILGTFYLFALCFTHGYKSITIVGESPLFEVFLNNVKLYFGIFKTDFNWFWSVLILLICFASYLSVLFSTRRNKFLITVLYLFIGVIGFIFSIGAYIFLSDSYVGARGIYGIGIYLAIIGIIATLPDKRVIQNICIIPVLLLSWLFFVFSFIYGNCLGAQKEYSNSYELMLHSDLNEIIDSSISDYSIQFINEISCCPQVNLVGSAYPVIYRLVPKGLGSAWVWQNYHFDCYYPQKYSQDSDSFDIAEFALIADRLLYNIYQNGSRILVEFKK